MTSTADDLVALYISQLQDELRNVSPAVRDRVVKEIAFKIEAERDAHGDDDVRGILREVGDPLDIAADVRERYGVRERSNWREIAAVVLLPFGGVVLPVAGWFVALYFLWSSPVWTVREKVAATLVLPCGALFPLLLVSKNALWAVTLVFPLGMAGYLAWQLRD